MSYKKLQIWNQAREIVIEVHEMSLKMPKFELMKKGHKSGGQVKQQKQQLLKVMAEDTISKIG